MGSGIVHFDLVQISNGMLRAGINQRGTRVAHKLMSMVDAKRALSKVGTRPLLDPPPIFEVPEDVQEKIRLAQSGLGPRSEIRIGGRQPIQNRPVAVKVDETDIDEIVEEVVETDIETETTTDDIDPEIDADDIETDTEVEDTP